MIVIEIPENNNCESVDMRVFHDLEPARPLRQVLFERELGKPVWYDITGWTTHDKPCPVVVQKVDDSGDGVAYLIHGGDAGLRFRPEGDSTPWSSDNTDQWGMPFIITSEPNDLREAQSEA